MKKIISIAFAAAFMLSVSGSVYAGAISDLAGQAGKNVPVPVKAARPAAAVSANQANNAAPVKQAEWLVMVYIAGVNNLGLFGAASLNVNQMEQGLSEAGSGSDIKMVVEYGELATDGLGTVILPDSTKTLLIQPDADQNQINSKVIGTSKNVDTGDVKSLENFVRRVKSRFPAKKTALIIWNHGGGIVGIASDDIHGSMMNLKNLSATLKSLTARFGKFDVLATDACLMQMASVAYEFKDYAKVIVGSEQPIPGAGYPYQGLARALVSSGSQIDAVAFGELIVEGYGVQYNGQPNTSLSAIETSKIAGFRDRLNSWTGLMLSDQNSFKIIAKANVLKEITRMAQLDCSRDLVHMIEVVNRQEGVSQAIKEAGKELKNYIENVLVIKNYADDSDNHGLAIYLPDLTYEANPYETLKFSAESNWSRFVKAVLQSRLDNGW